MKNTSFDIPYDEATILANAINMYTSGPEFRDVDKSLSYNEQVILDSFDDRVRSYKEKTREQYPGLFTILYDHSEAWKIPVVIEITTIELDLTIRAFEEAIEETKSDNFHDLEVITGFPIADIRRCLERLQNFRAQIVE